MTRIVSADATGAVMSSVSPYVSSHRTSNPSFPQPDRGSVRVWRYLDMARLVTLLSTRKLPFMRIGLFADPFEGSVPPSLHSAFPSPETQAVAAAERQWFRQLVYASCWREDDGESEAMWRLYCGQRDGVALQTTYEKLDASLPRNVRLGKVQYHEHPPEAARLPFALLPGFMRKRPAFAHEEEIRAIVLKDSEPVTGSRTPVAASALPSVIFVEWDLEKVVEHVFVSPYAEEWYRDAVAAVLGCFAPALAERLCFSQMRTEPTY